MARKDIRLKDNNGNYLYPYAHKDDDGCEIKTTYLRTFYTSQIVKNVIPCYAKNFTPDTPPADEEFSSIPPTYESGAYVWQCLLTTYLNNAKEYGYKVNLTKMLLGSEVEEI